MRKMPRPLDLSRFSGASGSGSVAGSKPALRRARASTDAGGVGRVERRELDVHALVLVVAVAVLDGVDDRLADGDADPVQRVVVEPDMPADVIADDLHEVEHLERAAEIETDGVAVRSCGPDGTRPTAPACEYASASAHRAVNPAPVIVRCHVPAPHDRHMVRPRRACAAASRPRATSRFPIATRCLPRSPTARSDASTAIPPAPTARPRCAACARSA